MFSTRFTALTASAAAILILITACATPATDSNITVKDAWVRPSVAPSMGPATDMTTTAQTDSGMNGPVSAAYMTIVNSGGKADRLISITSSAANVAEVHETYTQDGGLMGMRPVQGGLEVPANGSVALKPGSYHIMMMDLKQQLITGQTIKFSLKFQSGKQIDVDAPVKTMTTQ